VEGLISGLCGLAILCGWELDALSPVDLRQRVEVAIRAEIDLETWERAARIEAIERESLVSILSDWRAAKAS